MFISGIDESEKKKVAIKRHADWLSTVIGNEDLIDALYYAINAIEYKQNMEKKIQTIEHVLDRENDHTYDRNTLIHCLNTLKN